MNMRPVNLIMALSSMICMSSASLAHQTVSGSLLKDLVGKDINKIPESKLMAFEKFANKLLESVSQHYSDNWWAPDRLSDPPQTAFIWQFSERSKNTFLVYLCTPGLITPSSDRGWTFILNKDGKILDHARFDLGWRMSPKRASYVNVSWLSSKVIVQEMGLGAIGDGPRKIYFAFDRTEPVVVRIEDEHGNLYRMNHFAPNWIVGPLIRSRSKHGLLDALRGTNEARKLEVLIWLGGRHIENDSGSPGREMGPDFGLVQRLLKDGQVKSELLRLRADKNAYVRQLAKMVSLSKS